MKKLLATASVLALGVSHAGFAQSLPTDTVPVKWNEVTIQGIQLARPAPTVAARALAVVATAMYDAWTAYDTLAAPTQPGAGIPRQTGVANTADARAQAISYAAFRAELDLFANNPGALSVANAMMATLGYDPSVVTTDPATPAGIGNAAAAAVLAARHNDGSNQLGNLNNGAPYSDYSGYSTPNTPDLIADPNQWQPLRIGTAVQKFATPFWGAVKPFSPQPAFPGAGPARYPSAQYTADAYSILAYSAGLTDTTKVIAEYWADSPGTQLPPGHWSRIAEYVSRRDGHSQDNDVQMLFAVNNSLLDAGIAAWATKRTFNNERPITAIHYLFAGQQVFAWAGPGKGAQWIDGATWQPFQPANVVTPPFAEYTSGHSTFSAAASTILKNFTASDSYGGSYTAAAGSSLVEPGITPAAPLTLYFPTFSYAAAQAGLSRRYGGIHFVQGDLDGRSDGAAVGASAWTMAVTYFNGGKPCVLSRNGRPARGQTPFCDPSYGVAASSGSGGYGSGGYGSGGSGSGDDGHGHGGDDNGHDNDHGSGNGWGNGWGNGYGHGGDRTGSGYNKWRGANTGSGYNNGNGAPARGDGNRGDNGFGLSDWDN